MSLKNKNGFCHIICYTCRYCQINKGHACQLKLPVQMEILFVHICGENHWTMSATWVNMTDGLETVIIVSQPIYMYCKIVRDALMLYLLVSIYTQIICLVSCTVVRQNVTIFDLQTTNRFTEEKYLGSALAALNSSNSTSVRINGQGLTSCKWNVSKVWYITQIIFRQ